MILDKYYFELKNRTFLLFLSWCSSCLICYFYKNILLFEIVDYTNYTGLSLKNPYFIFSDVTDIFFILVSLILFISNQILLVLLSYHLLMFFSPGLYLFEIKILLLYIKMSFCFWIFTILILNHILFPFNWSFFISFHEQAKLEVVSLFFEANFKDFVNNYIHLYCVCIVSSQVSLTALFLLNFFNTNLQSMKQFRKFFYLLFVILSTIITPPDIFSQLLLSLLFILFYESFLLFKIFNKVTN